MECGTSVPLCNAVKPPSRGNWLLVDDVCEPMNTEVKGGSAANEGGTKVPHSTRISAVDVLRFAVIKLRLLPDSRLSINYGAMR